jgi:hypothetical protein
MSGSSFDATLAPPIAAAQRLIDRLDGQGLIIGGIAASLLGRARVTADVDVLLMAPDLDIAAVLELARTEGLEPRIADAGGFAGRSRVLLLRHVTTGIPVDVSLGLLPFEAEAIRRGTLHDVGSLVVRLPTPEDLIIMKAVAHRSQDLFDIEAIVQANPSLDHARVRAWVREFADVLDMPELWSDIAQWFPEN